MSETRKKTRGPTRAKLLEQVEEHEGIIEAKDAELVEAQKQVQVLSNVPPLLFTISINRVNGRIAAIPTLEGSSIEDLRLLLKGVNIHQTQIIDLLADAAVAAMEEGSEENEEGVIPGDEEIDNEDVVNEEENDNEEVVSEEVSEETEE